MKHRDAAEILDDLQRILSEVSPLMAAKAAEARRVNPSCPFDQLGLEDGADIVKEFLREQELGLAFEHLCYMVLEGELPISTDTYDALKAVGQSLRLPAKLWEPLAPRSG